MRHIGILGGTFNPIHNGHLILAETARDHFQLDEVWLIPSGCSYMKDSSKILPGEIRAKMVSLAIADHTAFKMSDIELLREGNTYTYETLTQLRKSFPEDVFYFIVGADTLFQMETWMKPDKIFSQAVILAAVRDGADDEALKAQASYLQKKYDGDIRFLPSLQIEISSTLVRTKCKEAKSIRYLVPEPVRIFLEDNGYYR